MRVGVVFPQTELGGDPGAVRAYGQRVAELGFTHILAYEGTNAEPDKWYWFEGNFAGYEANKVARLGEEAARPHRVTYRRLTRD